MTGTFCAMPDPGDSNSSSRKVCRCPDCWSEAQRHIVLLRHPPRQEWRRPAHARALTRPKTQVDWLRYLECRENEAAMKPEVFLCYAWEDRSAVRRLCDQLASDGVSPWFDESSLLPGEDWDLAIRRALRRVHAVLVCLSRTAINKRGYVQKELRFALDVADEHPEGAIFIIPVRLEACEVPDRLQKWQWVDLFRSDGYAKLLSALETRAASTPSKPETGVPLPSPLRLPRGLKPTASLQIDSFVWDFAFDVEGKLIGVACGDRSVKLWDTVTGQFSQMLPHPGEVATLAFHPKGEILATASYAKAHHDPADRPSVIRLYDLHSRRLLTEADHPPGSEKLLFSATGVWLASVGSFTNKAKGDVRLWNLGQETTLKQPFTLNHNLPNDGDFTGDSSLFATAGSDRSLRVWNTDTGAELARMYHDDEVVHVRFSPDGRLLATASKDGSARVWDPRGSCVHVLEHNGMVGAVAFSPNGSLVASASDDGARLWDCETGKCVSVLSHDDGAGVLDVCFGHGGRCILTGGCDDCVRVWSVPGGHELSRMYHDVYAGEVCPVLPSPDGRQVATQGSRESVLLWTLPTDALITPTVPTD